MTAHHLTRAELMHVANAALIDFWCRVNDDHPSTTLADLADLAADESPGGGILLAVILDALHDVGALAIAGDPT